MKYFLLAILLSLSACATNMQMEKDKIAFQSIIEICDLTSVNAKYGDCVKDGLDKKIPYWIKDVDADYIKAYIEWTNAAGARVEKGEMTEQQAKEGAKDLRIKLINQSQQAANQKKLESDNSMAAFLAGLAILGAAQPSQQYVQPNTTFYNSPGARPIMCTQIGNTVNCM